MPTYAYLCVHCGGFQASRPIAEAAAPQPCPECGLPAARTLASPHFRTSHAALRYLAEARNEKSANEPMIEHRLHGNTGRRGGHGGYSPATSGGGHAHVHRPWMIGH